MHMDLRVLLVLAASALAGCGEDAKPPHVEGSYVVNCESGCSRRNFSFSGDDGKKNTADVSLLWSDINLTCRVDSEGGGITSLQAFVSNQPLAPSANAGRHGIQILNTIVEGDQATNYFLRLWDDGIEYDVNSRDPAEDQELCTTYVVTLLSKKSFQLDFDCPEMVTMHAFNPRILELGSITFSECG